MSNKNAKPFLKWAGGKRQLLEQFEEIYPSDLKKNKIENYVEVFLGGGAVFFELIKKYDFEQIVLNDLNKELIMTYKVVRDDVDSLIIELKKLEENFLRLDEQEDRKEFYYSIRTKLNESKDSTDFENLNKASILHSAYFIFLNRTCFNGLYRVNKSGYFNVPFGKYKNPTICDEENLNNVSEALQDVVLISKDFEYTEKYIDNNSFVYFDPPYRPLTTSSSFQSYCRNGFGDSGQERLAEFYKHLTEMYPGAKLMLSNSNPKNADENDDFFVNLYNHARIRINEVLAGRAINSRASKRGKISELVMVNFKE